MFRYSEIQRRVQVNLDFLRPGWARLVIGHPPFQVQKQATFCVKLLFPKHAKPLRKNTRR